LPWRRFPTRRFIRVHPRKSVADDFLNCTKNTELTRARFARTVSFVLTKKKPATRSSRVSRSTINIPPTRAIVAHSGQRHMKSEQWKTYRTRFLVKAKQLSSALSFVDSFGRQHAGRKGDYLVESSDGVISIAPRQIFEDIYVPMSLTTDDPAMPPHTAPRKFPQPCRDRRGSAPRLGLM
jgi:hypothetical protein